MGQSHSCALNGRATGGKVMANRGVPPSNNLGCRVVARTDHDPRKGRGTHQGMRNRALMAGLRASSEDVLAPWGSSQPDGR
jgi:hypothetical protein